MKLNWFSPLPPRQTDIANYSQRVLEALSRLAEITIWTDQSTWDPQFKDYGVVRQYRDHPAHSAMDEAEATFYSVGNHAGFHGGIWLISQDYPGIMILHDTHLQHLFSSLYIEVLNKPEAYTAAMARAYGTTGLEAAKTLLKKHVGPTALAERFPLTALALENALGGILHNPSEVTSVEHIAHCPVTYLPLPFSAESARVSAHARKSGPPHRIVIMGYHGPNRQLNVILRALSQFERRDMFHLHIYGTLGDPKRYARMISGTGIRNLVTIHGFVPEDELSEALDRSHLAINLRYPSMGEASGTQLRLWRHALPTLVTQTAWYATLPEQAVAFVRPTQEIADIHRHLNQFLDDPVAFSEKGQQGQELLRQKHDPRSYAGQLIEIARRTSSE